MDAYHRRGRTDKQWPSSASGAGGARARAAGVEEETGGQAEGEAEAAESSERAKAVGDAEGWRGGCQAGSEPGWP